MRIGSNDDSRILAVAYIDVFIRQPLPVAPELGFGVEEVTSLLRRPAAHAPHAAFAGDEGAAGERDGGGSGGEGATAEDEAAEREEWRRRALRVSDSDREAGVRAIEGVKAGERLLQRPRQT